MRQELTRYVNWYNQFRPHESLDGGVPMDVYLHKRKRTRYYNIKGADPDKLKLFVTYLDDQKHLPIVTLRKVG